MDKRFKNTWFKDLEANESYEEDSRDIGLTEAEKLAWEREAVKKKTDRAALIISQFSNFCRNAIADDHHLIFLNDEQFIKEALQTFLDLREDEEVEYDGE